MEEERGLRGVKQTRATRGLAPVARGRTVVTRSTGTRRSVCGGSERLGLGLVRTAGSGRSAPSALVSWSEGRGATRQSSPIGSSAFASRADYYYTTLWRPPVSNSGARSGPSTARSKTDGRTIVRSVDHSLSSSSVAPFVHRSIRTIAFLTRCRRLSCASERVFSPTVPPLCRARSLARGQGDETSRGAGAGGGGGLSLAWLVGAIFVELGRRSNEAFRCAPRACFSRRKGAARWLERRLFFPHTLWKVGDE
ncbi:hypothetical protein MPTK1_6g04960 [Marchantia polymorpha subsp. ruderalis]|uniref:Uncharacterized protein n=2 Tax=Marchantia polymorpha TaxID=3197 RepID=A0AAF6BNN2_MARPO|nr:hypothetical protein MARPO_0034s0022 [Marchantia polymorpha]BBN13616.1 hypothetical protein Mp_6g04960 [Marchantia polymorpha subsp. ruderalis]|eukprot:PTQ41414.1 hypothetical protein MARPO_0034s0022 [Marchantia polymorpha]